MLRLVWMLKLVYSFRILAMEVMPDHIHLLLNCKPQFRISDMVKKEIRMTACAEGKEFYDAGEPYLINPVQKKLTIETEESLIWFYAGESALGKRTMLNEPEIPSVAIDKKQLSEAYEVKKLYPEGNAEARFKISRTKGFLYYCNQHGLFKVSVRP